MKSLCLAECLWSWLGHVCDRLVGRWEPQASGEVLPGLGIELVIGPVEPGSEVCVVESRALDMKVVGVGEISAQHGALIRRLVTCRDGTGCHRSEQDEPNMPGLPQGEGMAPPGWIHFGDYTINRSSRR